MTNKQKTNPKRLIMLLAAVIILAGAALGIYRLATYETANHADRLSAKAVEEYNRTVSGKAIAADAIRSREILLLDTVTKTHGQDSVAVFRIYQLPEGADGADYMHLRAEDAGQHPELTEMGTLTCRLVGNDISTVYNLKSSYSR